MKNPAKVVGVAAVGVAIVLRDERHIHVEDYHPIDAWGRQVTLHATTTTANMTSGIVVLSPKFV